MRRIGTFAVLALLAATFVAMLTAPASAEIEGPCVAAFNGIHFNDLDSPAKARERLVIQPGESVTLYAEVPETDLVYIDVLFPPLTITLASFEADEPSDQGGDVYIVEGELPLGDLADYGAGIFQFVGRTDDCSGNAFFIIGGIDPWETVVGKTAIGIAGVGILIGLTSWIPAIVAGGGGIIRSVIAGGPIGIGVAVLIQQAGLVPLSATSAGVAVAGSSVIAIIVTKGLVGIHGAGAVAASGAGGLPSPPPTPPATPPGIGTGPTAGSPPPDPITDMPAPQHTPPPPETPVPPTTPAGTGTGPTTGPPPPDPITDMPAPQHTPPPPADGPVSTSTPAGSGAETATPPGNAAPAPPGSTQPTPPQAPGTPPTPTVSGAETATPGGSVAPAPPGGSASPGPGTPSTSTPAPGSPPAPSPATTGGTPPGGAGTSGSGLAAGAAAAAGVVGLASRAAAAQKRVMSGDRPVDPYWFHVTEATEMFGLDDYETVVGRLVPGTWYGARATYDDWVHAFDEGSSLEGWVAKHAVTRQQT